MFKRQSVALVSDPICSKVVEGLVPNDFLYYDKDGFELNQAEQKFYAVMGFPIEYPILNHCCWQEPWYILEESVENLILDHCMILHRCSYQGAARNQLLELAHTVPYANLLLNTRTKWGYDFALDGISPEGTVFEVLHVEYDNNNYHSFSNHLLSFEFTIKHIDWNDAAIKVWQRREEWMPLKGFDQNHWKAHYLLGWTRSEFLEKAV